MKRMNSSIEGLKWYCVPVLLVLLALLTPSKGNAQALYGSIVGRVTDSSGAAVPGASVTIINKGTGQSRRAECERRSRFLTAQIDHAHEPIPRHQLLAGARCHDHIGAVRREGRVNPASRRRCRHTDSFLQGLPLSH